MTEFYETHKAFVAISSKSQQRKGAHSSRQVKTRRAGRIQPDIRFDPARHREDQKNHLSLMGQATGETQARRTAPNRTASFNLVTDFTDRAEHPAITAGKRALAESVRNAVYESIPPADVVKQIILSGDSVSIDRRVEIQAVDAQTEGSIGKRIGKIAQTGLTLVISDFQNAEFDFGSQHFDNVVGIKVNHPLEVKIPANIGVLSLGGYLEINTRKQDDLAALNQRLAEYHTNIADELAGRGLPVAQVVAMPRLGDGFDILATDANIANALNSLR